MQVPFSRPNICKSPKKELHRDLIDNLNNNFLKIYTRLIQVQTKCRFGKEFVAAIEEYKVPLNAVIDTLKRDGEIKDTLRKYDNALLKLNQDFRKFSEKEARSLFCFNILSDFRRAAASTGESLVIAVLIIRDTKCPFAHKKSPR